MLVKRRHGKGVLPKFQGILLLMKLALFFATVAFLLTVLVYFDLDMRVRTRAVGMRQSAGRAGVVFKQRLLITHDDALKYEHVSRSGENPAK
ncbi:hypothetical protein [Burkholderia ubonensis]|uniref:hypothetical protein n=1 Tax=Burkholderia ubonensis TaxID=101571 RepID=UPI000917251B|nr:hypothetical protein [Burkholderia ubonensis]OJA60630.1 hypothetical protein BGV69_03255 [Burkholderia ubonensis]